MKPLFIRVSKEILEELNSLKLPIIRIYAHRIRGVFRTTNMEIKESYADVVKRLLDKHKESMLGDKEDEKLY